jgi:pimeloyl-ACP methyl ester carboxylesterase
MSRARHAWADGYVVALVQGHDDEAEFDKFAEKFSLHPHVAKIQCPVLIQAEEDDELSPIEFTDELIAKIKARKKFVVWKGERHSIGGNKSVFISRRILVHHARGLVPRPHRRERGAA